MVSLIPDKVRKKLNNLVSFPTKQEFQLGDLLNFILANIGSGAGITETQHAALRQLIHLADNDGPMETFPTSYEETLPDNSSFPTSIIWYDQANPGLRKRIIANTLTYNGSHVATDTYLAYASDGITVLATLVDTYDYTTSFLTPKRTRTVS